MCRYECADMNVQICNRIRNSQGGGKLREGRTLQEEEKKLLKIGFKTLIGFFVFIHISKKDHCTSLITNATGCILVLGVRFFFFPLNSIIHKYLSFFRFWPLIVF